MFYQILMDAWWQEKIKRSFDKNFTKISTNFLIGIKVNFIFNFVVITTTSPVLCLFTLNSMDREKVEDDRDIVLCLNEYTNCLDPTVPSWCIRCDSQGYFWKQRVEYGRSHWFVPFWPSVRQEPLTISNEKGLPKLLMQNSPLND